MTSGNRLSESSSPYLLQHAGNPVHWQPWDELALGEARERDCPIFLSIGYSTCHWCHVMERESFEDDAVAHRLNQAFVCIKVDREERPDLDALYMRAAQLIGGRGGWPLNLMLTPDGKPFWAGTYLPRESRPSVTGLMELVPLVARYWIEKREELLADASRLAQAIARLDERGTEAPTVELGTLALRQLRERYDDAEGGFGSAPKFPMPHQLVFLLRHARRRGLRESREMAARTLQAIARRGLRDHVGTGYMRYSTDGTWTIPHFEKMLYDNALQLRAFAEAALEGTPAEQSEFRQAADAAARWLLEEMRNPEGAFGSAQDADSEGEEGRFHTWTPEELRAELGVEDAAWLAAFLQLPAEGNFADPHGTRHHCWHLAAGEQLVTATREERDRWEGLRRKLESVRASRTPPLLDDKVLCDWNGLALGALASAGHLLGRPEWIAAAERTASFLLQALRTPEGRLLHRWREGEAGILGMLEDHAFLTEGLLELFAATHRARWLAEAVDLGREAIRLFAHPEGGFHQVGSDGEPLLARTFDFSEGAIPSGNSAMAHALLKLWRLTGDPAWERQLRALFSAIPPSQRQWPLGAPWLVDAWEQWRKGGADLVLAGPAGNDLEQLVASDPHVAPGCGLLLVRLTPENAEALADLAPHLQGIDPQRPQLQLCEQFRCQLPARTPEEARALLLAQGECGVEKST
jgi:uncharacterized protein YyaL (SSP411 family)